jgi:hypothetical protein
MLFRIVTEDFPDINIFCFITIPLQLDGFSASLVVSSTTSTGMSKLKMVPRPTSLLMQISPPNRWTNF